MNPSVCCFPCVLRVLQSLTFACIQVREDPNEQPPSYARAISRVAPPRSLSPLILVLSSIASIWALIVGISYLKDLSDEGETKKLKAVDTVFAVLCFVAAGTEAFGFVAALSRRLSLIKQYARVALFNVLLLTGKRHRRQDNQLLTPTRHRRRSTDLPLHCKERPNCSMCFEQSRRHRPKRSAFDRCQPQQLLQQRMESKYFLRVS
jgi:hypothetical protein